jgi:hypothetical protein
MRYPFIFRALVIVLLMVSLAKPSGSASGNEKVSERDIAVLKTAEKILLSSGIGVSARAPEFIGKQLPNAIQRYRLALICWSLMRPKGVEETQRSRVLDATFWASVRSLSGLNDQIFVRRLIDDCRMQSGELLQALEVLHAGDEQGLREELRSRGVKAHP